MLRMMSGLKMMRVLAVMMLALVADYEPAVNAVNADDADILFGSSSDDDLASGVGNDSLASGDGIDILLGGSGSGGDRLNGDGSRTRTAVTNYTANASRTGSFSLTNIAEDLGNMSWFGLTNGNLPTTITASAVGAIFGSTIGNVIAGDNIFAQVAAGSAISTALSAVGHQFDKLFGNADPDPVVWNEITKSFETAEGLGGLFAANDNSPMRAARAA